MLQKKTVSLAVEKNGLKWDLKLQTKTKNASRLVSGLWLMKKMPQIGLEALNKPKIATNGSANCE